MKKSIAIICDDETFDRFWLNENISCFIKSKIINEKYGNFMFVSENDFDFYIMENLKDLDIKTCLKFYIPNQEINKTSFFIDKYINEFVKVDENCYDYIIKNADYIIFYVKEPNKFIEIAKENNKQFLNFMYV